MSRTSHRNLVAVSLALGVALAACSPSSDWTIESKKDEMTDQQLHFLNGKTTEEVVVPKTVFRPEEKRINPWFSIKFTEGGGYLIRYAPWPVQLDYGRGAMVAFRVDDNEPIAFNARSQSNSDVMAFEDRGSLLRQMRRGEKMILQYDSIDGKQTLRYSLDGFRSKLDKLCAKLKDECRGIREP